MLDLLAAVPVFGITVREDWVAGVLDAEDGDERTADHPAEGTPWNVTGRRAVCRGGGP